MSKNRRDILNALKRATKQAWRSAEKAERTACRHVTIANIEAAQNAQAIVRNLENSIIRMEEQ